MMPIEARGKQAGLSLLGWLLVVLAIGSVATLGIRLIPHYIEYRAIISVVKALPAERVHSMAVSEIRENLQRRFTVNNIHDRAVRDVIQIERARGGTVLTVSYQVQEPLFGNVDLLISFHEIFEYR